MGDRGDFLLTGKWPKIGIIEQFYIFLFENSSLFTEYVLRLT